jgi:phytoene synthase
MIKIVSPSLVDHESALMLLYAPVSARPGLAALLALDKTLSAILRTTREPIIGQMRLTWWYEALVRLDMARPPAEPVLQDLYNLVLPSGVLGAELAAMTDGWEILLEPVLDAAAIERFAVERGGRLFDILGRVLDVADPRIEIAGQGWALADLSQRLTDEASRSVARVRAAELLDRALVGRWPTRARALGALAVSARFDVSAYAPPPGSPKRVGRLLLHRLTGY